MPRDGSGVYSLPNAQFTPATTIASAAVNGDLADMVNDMNSARPITAGGTGQTTAIGSHDAFVSAGTPVASASTIAIDAVTGPLIDLTGNVTVTAVTLGAGKQRIVRATGTPLLTAGASLVVNGSATTNYQCIAGDLLVFQGYAGSIVDVWVLSRAQPAITTVASATTTNIGAAATSTVSITGTTTITAFDTAPAGLIREGTFAGALTLTHNAAIALPGGQTIQTTANSRFRAMSLGSGNWIVLYYIPASEAPVAPILGCARLVFTSTTVVTLTPYQGNQVTFPSGAVATIPSAGIASTVTSTYLNGTAAQPLVASTLYYAYLWNQGTAAAPNYVVDFSTTTHATDTATGIEIKSGDATRVLVGMVYPLAGPLFADAAATRLVASWFNQRRRQLAGAFTTARTTTSASFVEVNTEIRLSFLTWLGNDVRASYAGLTQNSGSNSVFTGVSLDGNNSANGSFYAMAVGASASSGMNASIGGDFLPSEGQHYVTVMGAVSGGTGTWQTGAGFTAQGQLSGGVTQ